MSKHLNTVKHDYIRYANCWEDAALLMNALQIKRGERCLSIASAGDNSFSMLVHHPDLVVAVDINQVQLFLCELKKEAIRALTRQEYLKFSGVFPDDNRQKTYFLIRDSLSDSGSDWWDAHLDLIEKGFVTVGKFERYFSLFRRKVMPLIHGKKRISELLQTKPEVEQQDFFSRTWNSFRWRFFFRLFFSKFMMGRFGRDPKFLNEVDISVSQFILSRAATHLSSVQCQENGFLHVIMTGNSNGHLPHFLREENYDVVRSNIDKIVFRNGLLEDMSAEYGRFDLLNMSNIF